MQKLFLTAGAWITGGGRGTLGGGEPVKWPPPPGMPQIPPAREIFAERVPRYGRYDDLTKLGCACVGMALRDGGLLTERESALGKGGVIGLISSSRLECLQTDVAYYATTLTEGGALASPNLFSYTLPGIMAGECAVNFKLAGPTLCVGEDGGAGMAALRQAGLLLGAGAAPAMIAGWVDWFAPDPAMPDPVPDLVSGATFVVLEAAPSVRARRSIPGNFCGVGNIFELFGA